MSRSQLYPTPVTPLSHESPRLNPVSVDCNWNRSLKQSHSQGNIFNRQSTMTNCSPGPHAKLSTLPPQLYTNKGNSLNESKHVPVNEFRRSSPLFCPSHSTVASKAGRFIDSPVHFGINSSFVDDNTKGPSVAAVLDRVRYGEITSPRSVRNGPLPSNSTRYPASKVNSEPYSEVFGINPIPDLSYQFDAIMSGTIPTASRTSVDFVRNPVQSPRETLQCSGSPTRKKRKSLTLLRHSKVSQKDQGSYHTWHSPVFSPGNSEKSYGKKKFTSKRSLHGLILIAGSTLHLY